MPPLFSGNGRHRRPRQAPSFVVTAGVAGAGIAIPLLGAGAANAADTETWDKVAACESGGLWSADEDNGYYGGLQLDQETWEKHGGTDFAERADLASRGQQIEVAERILRAEGTGTWSDCADNAGLSKDSPEKPDVNGDGEAEVPVPESPYPGGPSDQAPEDGEDGSDAELPDHATPPAPSEKPEPPADGSADPSDSPDPSSPGGEDESSEPTDPAGDGPDSGSDSDAGSGDASGPGEDSGPDDGASGGSGDGSGSGRDDEHPSREDDGRGEGAGSDEDHRVTPGESLSGIAEELDLRGGWPELYERNRGVVGSDPDLILPGQELRL